jgi:iron complex outermembrane receptor protein
MVRRLRRAWGAGALALAALCAAGRAAAADPAAVADDVPMVGQSVVVGERPRNRVERDATASATVVKADAFAGEVKGVAELVSTAPGVAVDGYGGLGQLATASIRGSAASGVLVLLDGIPLQTAFGGGVDLASIPRGWIDRVEIVRGAEGAHYGAGSLGGVVNVVTARPRRGAWSAELSGGSFGSLAGAGEVARPIGAGTLLLSASGERTDGDFPFLRQETPTVPGTPVAERRRNNGSWRAGALARASAPAGPGSLDAVALLSAGRRQLPGGIFALTPGDRQEDGRALLGARYGAEGPLDGLRLGAQLASRLEWLDAVYLGAPVSERFAAGGLGVDGILRHPLGLLRVELGGQLEGARGDGLSGTRTRTRLSASASEELRLAGERLRIAPAVRADRDGPFAGLSGKLGAAWTIAGPVLLRASAGRTFRAPTEAELRLHQGLVDPNPDLRPEVGLGGDAALVVEGGPVLGSLGAHATLYRDLVFYQQVSGGRFKPFNAGKALVRGVEAELATARLFQPIGLTLSASWTLLDTEILRGGEETIGNDVPHRARHRLYARAGVAPGPVDAHVELHAVGRQWSDPTNLNEVPPANVWNAGAGLLLSRKPAVRLDVEVRNLLDDRELQEAFGYPLPGRSAWVTLSAGSTDPKGTP